MSRYINLFCSASRATLHNKQRSINSISRLSSSANSSPSRTPFRNLSTSAAKMSKNVLITLDLQRGTFSRVETPSDYFSRLNSTLTGARAAGVQVIHITVHFRPGHPDISPKHATFSQIKTNGLFVTGSEPTLYPPELVPAKEDIEMTKKRVSGFTGTDLEVVLRSLGAETIVLAGISTSGAVLSTMKEAGDKDYGIVILRDLCLDPDEEVQRVLMDKIFARHTKVMPSEEWLKTLSA